MLLYELDKACCVGQLYSREVGCSYVYLEPCSLPVLVLWKILTQVPWYDQLWVSFKNSPRGVNNTKHGEINVSYLVMLACVSRALMICAMLVNHGSQCMAASYN